MDGRHILDPRKKLASWRAKDENFPSSHQIRHQSMEIVISSAQTWKIRACSTFIPFLANPHHSIPTFHKPQVLPTPPPISRSAKLTLK